MRRKSPGPPSERPRDTPGPAAHSTRRAFITASGGTTGSAFSALLAGLDAGKAYFNIHSSFAGGGEIRGFLAVPEPSALALLGGALALLALRRRAPSR